MSVPSGIIIVAEKIAGTKKRRMKMSDNTMDNGDKVSVSLSFKKNLGNYQSLDVYTGVTVTVRDGEAEADTYTRAWKIVEDQLETELEKVEAELKGSK
jgi:hypothetical protein